MPLFFEDIQINLINFVVTKNDIVYGYSNDDHSLYQVNLDNGNLSSSIDPSVDIYWEIHYLSSTNQLISSIEDGRGMLIMNLDTGQSETLTLSNTKLPKQKGNIITPLLKLTIMRNKNLFEKKLLQLSSGLLELKRMVGDQRETATTFRKRIENQEVIIEDLQSMIEQDNTIS